MTGEVGRCAYYAVAMAYVSERYPFLRVVRKLEGAGGRIEYLDEVSRRIVASLPLPKVKSLAAELVESGALTSLAVEAKASCSHNLDPKLLHETLKRLGFIVASKTDNARVYLGRHGGRVVEVELAGRRLRVKIGRTIAGRPRTPLPPGLFALGVDELDEAYSELRRFINAVAGQVKVGGTNG